MDTSNTKLKQLFTGYWDYLPVQTACKLSIFDAIEKGINTLQALSEEMDANKETLFFLLEALVLLHLISKKKERYYLLENGALLTDNHPKSVKYSCILWGGEHLTAWQNLEHTIRTGKPAFDHCFKAPFFEYLKTEEESNRIYHKAMFEYARDDYENITEVIDFSNHKVLMDVGGGLGALLMAVRNTFPSLSLTLFESENVIKFLPKNHSKLFSAISGDFFKEIPPIADGIIMSRIIHDWEDKKARLILKNVYNALPSTGKLYLVEILKDNLKDGAALLSLNMLLICNSYERKKEEYLSLLREVGFKVKEVKSLNTLQSIIICEK